MDLYWAGSDWLTLAAAAELCTEVLGSKKTEDDVIRAGYTKYDGIRHPLRICTFARQPIEIRPAEPLLPAFPWREPLTDQEMKIAFRALNSGDIFELHWTILERTLLLRDWKTTGEVTAVIRAYSGEELPFWNHHPSSVEGGRGHWTAVFDGVITPDIEIRREDLRVDRQELLGFLDEAKQARASNNGMQLRLDEVKAVGDASPGSSSSSGISDAGHDLKARLWTLADQTAERIREAGGYVSLNGICREFSKSVIRNNHRDILWGQKGWHGASWLKDEGRLDGWTDPLLRK